MDLLKYRDFHDYGLPYAKAANSTDIMANIEYLYQKIKQCTRNVTYFDLYKINTIITQDSEFESQVNALEPYTTAIINSHIATATTSYSPGDMVVKNIDGTISTIFAQRGGIFYPKQMVKNSTNESNYTYEFLFAFQPASPSVASDTAICDSSTNTWNANYAKNIIFSSVKSGAPISPYNNVLYKPETGWAASEEDQIGIVGEEIQIQVDSDFTDNNTPIDPIIHCYANNEEIYMDQHISYTTTGVEGDETMEGYFLVKLPKTSICTKVVIK